MASESWLAFDWTERAEGAFFRSTRARRAPLVRSTAEGRMRMERTGEREERLGVERLGVRKGGGGREGTRSEKRKKIKEFGEERAYRE